MTRILIILLLIGSFAQGQNLRKLGSTGSTSTLYGDFFYLSHPTFGVGDSLKLTDKKYVDVMLALKLSLSDTTAMLSPYVHTAGFGIIKTGQSFAWDSSVASANYWRISGNITTTAKNFGTLDNNDVVLISNGTERGRLLARGVLAIGGSPSSFQTRGIYVQDTVYALGGLNLRNGASSFIGFSQAGDILSIKASNTTITTVNNSNALWQTNRANGSITGSYYWHANIVNPQPGSASTAHIAIYRANFNYAALADTATYGPRLNGRYTAFLVDSTSWQLGGYRHIPFGWRAFENYNGENYFNTALGKTGFGIASNIGIPYGVSIYKSLGIHKDSLPTITAIDDGFLLVVDSSSNQTKKILPGNLGLGGGIQVLKQTATDAAFAAADNASYIELVAITAARDFTLPTQGAGKMYIIHNKNTSGNAWNVVGNLVDAAGSALTTIPNSTVYLVISDGTNFVKIN